jgi:hypothetical protein
MVRRGSCEFKRRGLQLAADAQHISGSQPAIRRAYSSRSSPQTSRLPHRLASERSGIVVWTEQDPAAAGGGWRSPASAEPRCVALAHPPRPPLDSGARYRRRRTPTSRSTSQAHAAAQDPSRGRRRRDDLRSHVASTRARPRAETRSRSFSSLVPCNGERPRSRVVRAPRPEGGWSERPSSGLSSNSPRITITPPHRPGTSADRFRRGPIGCREAAPAGHVAVTSNAQSLWVSRASERQGRFCPDRSRQCAPVRLGTTHTHVPDLQGIRDGRNLAVRKPTRHER